LFFLDNSVMAGQDEPNAFLMSIVRQCEETGEDSDWKAIALYLMTPEGIAESERGWGRRRTKVDNQGGYTTALY
jgi:hypothetical protein